MENNKIKRTRSRFLVFVIAAMIFVAAFVLMIWKTDADIDKFFALIPASLGFIFLVLADNESEKLSLAKREEDENVSEK